MERARNRRAIFATLAARCSKVPKNRRSLLPGLGTHDTGGPSCSMRFRGSLPSCISPAAVPSLTHRPWTPLRYARALADDTRQYAQNNAPSSAGRGVLKKYQRKSSGGRWLLRAHRATAKA